jgi:hypothetical protein
MANAQTMPATTRDDNYIIFLIVAVSYRSKEIMIFLLPAMIQL